MQEPNDDDLQYSSEGMTTREVLQSLLRWYPGIRTHLDLVAIAKLWQRIYPPFVTNATTDFTLQRGILIVHLSNAALRNEFNMNRDIIRNNLNRELGREVITDIRFR